MRPADFSWEAPPSPVKTTTSSTAIIALLLRHKRRSVPPKEPNACLSNLREDASPKASTHRSFLSLTRFTLIYPSCSGPSLATTVPAILQRSRMTLLRGFGCKRNIGETRNQLSSYTFRTMPTLQSNDNRSLKVTFRGVGPFLRGCCRGVGRSRSEEHTSE